MYPKAWDIYTFCAQTSILGFEQSGVGLVSLYYKKNEFENYDNEYQSFSKNYEYYDTLGMFKILFFKLCCPVID